ncbi:hypothetical protein [Rhizobium sp. NLR22b]|uniref:hypothetical protein n=1 Tax=Rhizobium sp. NLR22b TaxID=2731115 RepID=UPI001C82E290|nr:hypothetical protein [Rhizobium sp. NLR22b]MBX5242790.1 hypothetical protein [Rhizobium sp. NLR22b]
MLADSQGLANGLVLRVKHLECVFTDFVEIQPACSAGNGPPSAVVLSSVRDLSIASRLCRSMIQGVPAGEGEVRLFGEVNRERIGTRPANFQEQASDISVIFAQRLLTLSYSNDCVSTLAGAKPSISNETHQRWKIEIDDSITSERSVLTGRDRDGGCSGFSGFTLRLNELALEHPTYPDRPRQLTENYCSYGHFWMKDSAFRLEGAYQGGAVFESVKHEVVQQRRGSRLLLA